MISLSESKDYDSIKKIITNPRLFRMTQDGNIEDFEVNKSNTYLLLNDQYSDQIGCFMVKLLTNIVLEVHMFILPKYWKRDITAEAVKLGHKWAKEQGFMKTYTKVPAIAVHMLKFLSAVGYKVCGMLENGIIRENKLMILFFYEFDLGES